MNSIKEDLEKLQREHLRKVKALSDGVYGSRVERIDCHEMRKKVARRLADGHRERNPHATGMNCPLPDMVAEQRVECVCKQCPSKLGVMVGYGNKDKCLHHTGVDHDEYESARL